MDYTTKSCREFVTVLASSEPAPGGGGASALVAALGTALGLVFVQVSGYSDTVREIAAGTAAGFATKTKDIVFFAYTVVPGILSLLSAIPIFKYDIVGKKKQEISDALQARRTAAAAEK